jgi:hypothetical protein
MRVSDSLLETVVFLGYATDAPGKGGIDCIGTGFLLIYDEIPHLVTVRHVADQFGADPFLIRVNRIDRTGENIHIDGARWHFADDPVVDVAVMPFDLRRPTLEYAARYIDDSKETWWWNKARKYGAGIGDFVYTVGLFRVLAGAQRMSQLFTLELSRARRIPLAKPYQLGIGGTLGAPQLSKRMLIW